MGELQSQEHQRTTPQEQQVEAQAASTEQVDWLGNFRITHYTFALESDPVHRNSPKVHAPGLSPDEKYHQSFLGNPYGVEMQGTGLAENGKYIRWVGGGRYAYGVGGAAGAPQQWKSIAVDPRVIPYGSQVIVEPYRDRGPFDANDTGGAIRGNHIDVFAGAVPISVAYALGTKYGRVGILRGGRHQGGGHQGGGHQGGGHQGGGHQGGGHHGGGHHGGGHHGGGHHGGGHQGGGQTQTAGGQGDHHGHAPIEYRPAASLEEVKAGHAVLKEGDQGPAVRFVQEHVGASPDSRFGNDTKAAVMRYQSVHHLSVDGIVGVHTVNAILGRAQNGAGGQPQQQHGGGHEHGHHHDGGQQGGGRQSALTRETRGGAEQMSALLSVATNSRHPGGMCYAAVKGYIARAGGYGNIHNVYTDPRFSNEQMYAHDFADVVNRNPREFGLQRLGINSPYDAPAGAIVVVKHGSPGTHNPIAGDIAVRGQGLAFYNDGLMGYHGPQAWPPPRGGLLGAYVPL